MSTLTVYDSKGASVGTLDVPAEWLAKGKGEQAVHDVIVAYRAGRRAGTASTLRKGEVAGSNKKPWRQKGTGRARGGYRQSPVWRGGGVAFGPHPRGYSVKINKKVARLALKRVFSGKLSDGSVRVIEELAVPEPRTRHIVALLKALQIKGPALLVADREAIDKAALAARNMTGVEVASARGVNVYQMLRFPVVIFSRAALREFEGRLDAQDGRNA